MTWPGICGIVSGNYNDTTKDLVMEECYLDFPCLGGGD